MARSCHALLLVISNIILVHGEESANAFIKPHYTEVHQELHRLVRRTTHSHLQDFEIVFPSISPSLGSQNRRHKRDVFEPQEPQRLKLYSHGQDFDVELSANPRLLSGDFTVQRITGENGKRQEVNVGEDELNCHNIGRMISHENLTTAISTCNGLSGLLRTGEEDFIIEPVPSHLLDDFSEQKPHIVYKASDMGGQSEEIHVCGKQRHHPIPTSLDENLVVKELSNGEIIIFERENVKTRENKEETFSLKRHKRGEPLRNPKKRKVVETLVVADHHLLKKQIWSLSDVTSYVLTIMNMVASLYKDASLDDQVDIVVVGLIILEDDKEFNMDHKADKSLANFCRWQAKLNSTTGHKPDHSILITGADICIDKNQPCDTLGLAQIGGMCTKASCTINEDSGLGVAFTIAHETGHSFGMTHDGQGNTCSKHSGHLMSPKLLTANGVFTWSSCSRKTMAKFLRSERSKCLDNEPMMLDIALPKSSEELPGQQYNADLQCQLQYGLGSQLCYARYHLRQESICKALWCQVGFRGICRTKTMPAAEGTSCGTNKWCRRGQCVPRGSAGPTPIDGGWSRYGGWSGCSRTCGSGVSFKQRFCNNPAPLYGGRHCGLDDKIFRVCNPRKCPPDAQSYRAQQCARYNSRPYRRQYFSWVPFTKFWKYDFNSCELYCEAEGYGFFDKLSSQVLDGTSCDDESNDVCIDGECEHVGCDFVLNSNATVDACGVCNGDNSTCRFHRGSFAQRVNSGYHKVVVIPQGARTVRVWEERCCTRAFIAARSATNRTGYFLNGNWRVDHHGVHKFAGVRWTYDRPTDRGDILFTKGPLTEDVVIELLLVGRNPIVSYSYAVEKIENTLPHDGEENRRRHSYSWEESYSTCSKSCGGGIQRSTSMCKEDGRENVIDSYCEVSTRPPSRTRKCNTQVCGGSGWVAEEWGTCSRSCGGGLQTRRISCQRQFRGRNVNVNPRECNNSHKPEVSRSCGTNSCPPKWVAAKWTECSRTCGRGVQTRIVYCRSGMERLPSAKCSEDSRPINRQACSTAPCTTQFLWSLSDWSSCSSTCGQGQQRRTLKCSYRGPRGRLRTVPHARCRSLRKPRATLLKSCSLSDCQPASTRRSKTTVVRRPKQQTRVISLSTTRRPPTTRRSRIPSIKTTKRPQPRTTRAPPQRTTPRARKSPQRTTATRRPPPRPTPRTRRPPPRTMTTRRPPSRITPRSRRPPPRKHTTTRRLPQRPGARRPLPRTTTTIRPPPRTTPSTKPPLRRTTTTRRPPPRTTSRTRRPPPRTSPKTRRLPSRITPRPRRPPPRTTPRSRRPPPRPTARTRRLPPRNRSPPRLPPRTSPRPRPAQQTPTSRRRIVQRRPRSQWVSSGWQACTRTCGGGKQVRAVKCMANGRPSVACSYTNKPENIRPCNTASCTPRSEPCKDLHNWCHMVPQQGNCTHAFFSGQCCKSCKGAKKFKKNK